MLRLERQWSQPALAQACGLSIATVQTLESSRHVARGETLTKIAAALDTTIDTLLGVTPLHTEPVWNRETVDVARAYQSASTALRQRIAAQLRGEPVSDASHFDLTPAEEELLRQWRQLGSAAQTALLELMKAFARYIAQPEQRPAEEPRPSLPRSHRKRG
jgi:transcriptional regulator with XRE-family HTH domain